MQTKLSKSVNELLSVKGHDVSTIAPGATVFDALESMARRNIGALVVVEHDKVCGLVSERDYARKVILHGRRSADTLVRDVMTAKVVCVRPADEVEACMALMTKHRVRHLPVLDDGRLVGIVSIGDVVKAIIDEQKYTIEQLEQYITGRA